MINTYVFEVEVVPAELEIYNGFLVLTTRVEKVDECAADLLIEAVVSHVQAQQGFVLAKGHNHLLDATVLFCIVGQVVRLEVKIAERRVLAQGQSKGSGGKHAKTIALQFELA